MVVKAQPTWLWLELFPFNGNKLKQFLGVSETMRPLYFIRGCIRCSWAVLS